MLVPKEITHMAVWKVLSLCTMLVYGSNLFAADPFVGTWKLDLAHTATTPPNPTAPQPKQVTLTIQEQGDHRVVKIVGTNADGSPIRGGFTVPVTGGPGTLAESSDSYDGLTLKYATPTVHDLIYTKGDKAVATRHVVLSPDHKTMTTTYKGADEQGSPTTRVEVWHRR
jgi:hypothetical protein